MAGRKAGAPPALPYELEVAIVCPTCAVEVVATVQLGVALTSRFGKGRIGVALKAPRFEHACGQLTVDTAIAQERDGDVERPRLLPA